MNRKCKRISYLLIGFAILMCGACSGVGNNNSIKAAIFQKKSIKHGEMTLEVLAGKNSTQLLPGDINIRLTLYSDTLIKGNEFMQYMNFGLSRNIYGLYDKDTILNAFCERIPGIS